MGQIIGGAAKPKRCNLNKLSQLGTPAAGEHILVSSDNSMNAAGQGNFDCYIVGDGRKAATELILKPLGDIMPTELSLNGITSGGVYGELNSFSQNVAATKILIKPVAAGRTLHYEFSNNYRKVACIGFFTVNDTLIGSYIGNTSSGGAAGKYNGEVVVPQNAFYLKAACSEAFDIILYYKDTTYERMENIKKSIQNVDDKFGAIYNYDDTYIDIFSPSGNSLIPANDLCFTYEGYKVDGALPAVVLYAPTAAGTTISGSLNLVSISGSTGTRLLTEAFSVQVGTDGYATILFSAPYNSTYDGANVCVQFGSRAVRMESRQTNTGFKYFNPADNSVTAYDTYKGYFTIAEVNPFATKDYVKNAISDVASSMSVCTPDDNLQEFITNNRIVNLITGTYNIATTLTIPSNTKIVGVRGGTIIKLNGATTAISFSGSEKNVQLENLTFEGGGAITRVSKTISQLRSRDGIGTEVGIYFTGHASNIVVTNCEFKNFSHSGMHFYMTMTSSGQQGQNVKVTDCIFSDSWAGVLLGQRAEFHTFVNCSFNNCVVGAYVCGGNNVFDSSRFELNGTGIVIYGNSGWNDSHGHTTNCSFDHSLGYGIACTGVNNGYTFANCHIFDGTGFVISNSVGVSYVGGILACKIVVDSPRSAGFNLIHDVMFFSTASYDTGTIEGDTTRLSMKNNRFMMQDDYSSINNDY